jgi:hypothetical protein
MGMNNSKPASAPAPPLFSFSSETYPPNILVNNISALMTNNINQEQYSALFYELKNTYSDYFNNETKSLCVMRNVNSKTIIDSTKGSEPYGYNSASEATNRIAYGPIMYDEISEPNLSLDLRDSISFLFPYILGKSYAPKYISKWIPCEPSAYLGYAFNPYKSRDVQPITLFQSSVQYTIRVATLSDGTDTLYGFVFFIERNKRTPEMNRDGSEQYQYNTWPEPAN